MSIAGRFTAPGRILVAGAPEGYDAIVLGSLAADLGRTVLFIGRDDARMARVADALAFFHPEVEVLDLPAWDCLPYDRVSPNGEIVARRLSTLIRVTAAPEQPAGAPPRVLLTTVSASLQKLPPRNAFDGAVRSLARGDRVPPEELFAFLGRSGYVRAETVLEPGEFAVRGGIVDVFPPGRVDPVRLDFFGDDLETLRVFDPASQRSQDAIERLDLAPVSEVVLTPEAVTRFRSGYRSLFGAVRDDDPLYAAISEGRRHAGLEHWLPLFYERLETLFDYLPDAAVVLDQQFEAARDARFDQVVEYYAARRDLHEAATAGGLRYNPVPPETLFIDEALWNRLLEPRAVGDLAPFAAPDFHSEGEAGPVAADAGGQPGIDFAEARKRGDTNVFDALAARIADHREEGRQVVVAAVSAGSQARLAGILAEHGLSAVQTVDSWQAARRLGTDRVAIIALALERGFSAPGLAVISEADILGDRLIRRAARRRKAENIITEAASLTPGDLVVHADHGIGRYDGLETISVAGAPHDCLRLLYAADDKLFLPVENIEMIGRFGSDSEGVQLDRLGAASWQARKARLKERIREMAAQLIAVAAQRALKSAPELVPASGAFDEFCARFPYTETEDQARAITEALDDLSSGRPVDRLVCGDVGFGKTEVALRAAFVTAMEGRQVAVVVPTTLLARQHTRSFRERFSGFPVRIEQLSRLVSAKDARGVKAGLADGTVDIVIGTHALLAKSVTFRDLALLIIDEEQHFGVAHKEALKALKSDVHVLTLTATPIPRTLQLALSGVRQMSLIATPPVDRLAVRTFVLPYDPVVIREAILRERYRGGQTFYVCPRIEDLAGVRDSLAELVPEVKIITAHGRLAAKDLEAAVGAFYDGQYDVLLATNIVESGLDLPAVNTIIIHRADMFGLAQLYQLRGRVGRSKLRAYAYLTLPPRRKLTPAAQKRLEVMQSLDSLGAGFTLASHDLDIRGAGNLLGDEQSGQIREVGIELYQRMLEEAVAEARGLADEDRAEAWSPQIAIGLGVLLPESYVPDLGLRMGLYRRLSDLPDEAAIEAFAAELIDRFGPLPAEVENLLQVVAIKQLCRRSGVEKVDAGAKGAVISFRNNTFANPAGLVSFIQRQRGTAKVRPDHKLVFKRDWVAPATRLSGVRRLIGELSAIAAAG